jgi:hypothetical protein
MQHKPRRPILRRALLTVLTGLLTACATAPPVPELPGAVPDDFPGERYRQNTGSVLRIDGGRLVLKVYRGGRLKHLGHNHVITSDAIAGLLWLSAGASAGTDADAANGYADLYVPLASLIVDPPAARQAAGPDFSSEPSDRDREGTRRNLLGPKVLDAANHPYLRATIDLTSSQTGKVMFGVAGKQTSHNLPFAVERQPDGSLTVSASFELTHEALGIRPFTALGGAIAVADPIRVAVTLQAQPG